MRFKKTLLGAMFLLGFVPFAQAYIGPGMAGGAVVAILGFILGILFLLFAIIYFPLKRIFLGKTKVAKED